MRPPTHLQIEAKRLLFLTSKKGAKELSVTTPKSDMDAIPGSTPQEASPLRFPNPFFSTVIKAVSKNDIIGIHLTTNLPQLLPFPHGHADSHACTAVFTCLCAGSGIRDAEPARGMISPNPPSPFTAVSQSLVLPARARTHELGLEGVL